MVAHEATDGVTDCTSGLIYLNESGALNESFSDVLATSAEFYADANGLDPTVGPDWQLGEDVYLPADSALGFRNMADPEEDGDPDHYSERQVGGGDNGGVHTNSDIPNHAYYLLVNGGLNSVSKLNASCASPGDHNSAHCTGAGTTEVTAIDLEDAEQIFFLAFTALSENATTAAARAATEAVATPLGSQQLDSTTAVWVAVGVGPTSPVTDIAITSVSAPSSVVQGDEVSVNVTVENVGNQDVGSDITVLLTESPDGDFLFPDQVITGGLLTGASATPTFSWSTTLSTTLGNYTLEASHNFTDDNAGNDTNSTTVTVNEPGGVCEPPLLPAGASCDSDSQCCSNKCKGRRGAKTCK